MANIPRPTPMTAPIQIPVDRSSIAVPIAAPMPTPRTAPMPISEPLLRSFFPGSVTAKAGYRTVAAISARGDLTVLSRAT